MTMGFTISVGQNSDRVNVIALCRGDINPDVCLVASIMLPLSSQIVVPTGWKQLLRMIIVICATQIVPSWVSLKLAVNTFCGTCTPDLSQEDCTICLERSFQQIPQHLAGEGGSRLFRSTYYLQFEMQCFYNDSPDSAPPSLAPCHRLHCPPIKP
ncbi:hypothetical protein CRYUN_Cryun31cG0019400 [Craigia yunnanensis]